MRDRLKQVITFLIIVAIAWITSSDRPSLAAETIDSAQIFTANCSGCHINGGNIVKRNKNLKQKTLQKYKMDSADAIAEIVTNGKNNMPAYRDRLSESEIKAVAAYVLERAENNWKN
jgi:cytochrome c6